MRVFIGGILTETNTFSPVPTGLSDFRFARVGEHDDDLPNEGLALSHLCDQVAKRGWVSVPSFLAIAEPAGTTTRHAYETLREQLLQELKSSLPVDMVLLPLHGAMVANGYDDCEADIVKQVRRIVGEDIPVGVLLDLHCHLSQSLVDTADLITIYREYPHTDILQRAEVLLDMTANMAQGHTQPVMAIYDCRIINLYPTSPEPMRSLVNHLSELDQRPGIISADIAHGFPWGDVEDCGTRTLVVADNNPDLAARTAEELGQRLYQQRHELQIKPLAMDKAFARISSNHSPKAPLVIADIADNAGGGAPSDSTFALAALLQNRIIECALGMIYDPQVVNIAMQAGVGAGLKVRLGGKTSSESGNPLDLLVKVIGIQPAMTQLFPQEGCDPLPVPCGDSVCLLCDGIHIIVNSVRTQVFNPGVFTAFGLDLKDFKALIVKSIFHFYAAFRPIASDIILMSPPGALNANFTEVPYQKAKTDKYPWLDNPLSL